MENLYITLTTDDIFVTTYNKKETEHADFSIIGAWIFPIGKDTDFHSIPQSYKNYVTVKDDTINNI